MITLEQIRLETIDPLDDDQILALTMLVKQYDEYKKNIGLYPNVPQLLASEKSDPSVKTKGLKAVLTALGKLPRLVVESSGSEKSQSFFSSKQNWDALAKDVLDVLYEVPIVDGDIGLLVFQRTVTPNNCSLMGRKGFFFISD